MRKRCHSIGNKGQLSHGPKPSEMSNLSSRIIDPVGNSQSVRLYQLEINRVTIPQLEGKMSGTKYTPPKDSITEGFANVESKGRKVRAEFQISFKVPVRYYEGDEAKKQYYMSTEKGNILIDLTAKIIEVRGSERLARRFRRFIYSEFSELAPSIEPLSLVALKSSQKFYDAVIKASEVKSKKDTNINHAVYSNVEAQKLDRVDFRGQSLRHKKEVTVYGTMHQGTISSFSGQLVFPSNAKLKISVNCENGSMLIFRTEDGILEKDLRWIIDQMIATASE